MLGPFAVLLGQEGTNQAVTASRLRMIPTTSILRRPSQFMLGSVSCETTPPQLAGRSDLPRLAPTLLLYPDATTAQQQQRLNERVGQTNLGVAMAHIFGLAVPHALAWFKRRPAKAPSSRHPARVTLPRHDFGEDEDVSRSRVRIPGRVPLPPLEPEWLIVDHLPLFHRVHVRDDHRGVPIVHVHGFGISGTYLEPTAAVLAAEHPTYVPDLPGMGRSLRPKHGLDLAGLARALVTYCDAMGLEKPVLVGNSLGCPIIVEVAASFPGRIASAVLVSPAGGPNNQPMAHALRQMAQDGLREPPSMLPIAVRDYLRFGALQSLSLFKAMTRYPTLDNLHLLDAPTLVIAGARDPLVKLSRAFVLAAMPHVTAVKVPGAHALNFSSPELIAELVEAHVADKPLLAGPLAQQVAELVAVYDSASSDGRPDVVTR